MNALKVLKFEKQNCTVSSKLSGSIEKLCLCMTKLDISDETVHEKFGSYKQ